MAIDATATKNALCSAYVALAERIGALTAMGSANAAGTEPSGGSPAYARKTLSWGSPSAGAVSATAAVIDIPSGATIVGVNLWTAAAVHVDKASVTSQAFASQGTYTVTPTYTQT